LDLGGGQRRLGLEQRRGGLVPFGTGPRDLLLADRVGFHRLLEPLEVGLGAPQPRLGRLDAGLGSVTQRLIGLRLDHEEQVALVDEGARFEGDPVQVSLDPCPDLHRLACLGRADELLKNCDIALVRGGDRDLGWRGGRDLRRFSTGGC